MESLELAVFSSRGLVVLPLEPGKQLVIGRAEASDIAIEDDAVSRRHAIVHTGPPIEIEDVSANGTYLSRAGRPSNEPRSQTADPSRIRVTRTTLEAGDTVFLGSALIVVRPASTSKPPATPRSLGLDGFDAVVRAPALARVYEEAARAAKLSLPILVLGETGVGKDVLARFVHHASPRAKKPFIALNCAALSETLAESELFGHEKGAFTGAQQTRAGIFEAADGGTIFLDEIGELPLGTQAKLLRTLESSEVQRLGSVRPIKIDVRLVSATNRDLERSAKQGRFRQDLFFRVNGLALHVPPLRERVQEIGALARRFLVATSTQAKLPRVPEISEDALRALEGYAWPGNVRELRHVMERTLVTAGDGPILPSHLPPQIGSPGAAAAPQSDPASRERVVEALAECDGNQTRAAEMLGVSRRTLINRMIEFDLPRPRKS